MRATPGRRGARRQGAPNGVRAPRRPRGRAAAAPLRHPQPWTRTLALATAIAGGTGPHAGGGALAADRLLARGDDSTPAISKPWAAKQIWQNCCSLLPAQVEPNAAMEMPT